MTCMNMQNSRSCIFYKQSNKHCWLIFCRLLYSLLFIIRSLKNIPNNYLTAKYWTYLAFPVVNMHNKCSSCLFTVMWGSLCAKTCSFSSGGCLDWWWRSFMVSIYHRWVSENWALQLVRDFSISACCTLEATVTLRGHMLVLQFKNIVIIGKKKSNADELPKTILVCYMSTERWCGFNCACKLLSYLSRGSPWLYFIGQCEGWILNTDLCQSGYSQQKVKSLRACKSVAVI